MWEGLQWTFDPRLQDVLNGDRRHWQCSKVLLTCLGHTHCVQVGRGKAKRLEGRETWARDYLGHVVADGEGCGGDSMKRRNDEEQGRDELRHFNGWML
jgi:hypothetical protein